MSLRVLVGVKRVIDYAVKVRTGQGVEESQLEVLNYVNPLAAFRTLVIRLF